MIHGQGTLYGDGMAMWLTKQRGVPGTVFGSTDRFDGLGIFFDTYKNNRPGVQFPYVMAMMGDGQTTYDQGNDGKANELAGCSVGEPLQIPFRPFSSPVRRRSCLADRAIEPGSCSPQLCRDGQGTSDLLPRRVPEARAAAQRRPQLDRMFPYQVRHDPVRCVSRLQRPHGRALGQPRDHPCRHQERLQPERGQAHIWGRRRKRGRHHTDALRRQRPEVWRVRLVLQGDLVLHRHGRSICRLHLLEITESGVPVLSVGARPSRILPMTSAQNGCYVSEDPSPSIVFSPFAFPQLLERSTTKIINIFDPNHLLYINKRTDYSLHPVSEICIRLRRTSKEVS